jgi:salicylate hydroxylase
MKPPCEAALVIGAGLSGLAASLALLRAGWKVHVFEQAAALGEVGAGITLSPGACRGLASLGLEEALLAASQPVPDIAFLHYRSGEVLTGTLHAGPPPDVGLAGPRHIHRADLHAILLGAVRRQDPDCVATAKRLIDVRHRGAAVVARFADGTVREAPLLLAADGIRSSVRQTVFDASPAVFAGQVAFRCLIPANEAAPFLGGGSAAVFVGASRIFNRYLVRRGTLLNVIGIAKSERWREEGWNTPATVAEFTEEFSGFHPDVLALIERAPPPHLIKWGLFVRPPLPDWSAGHVLLLGDAAHPVLPFLGLGAALAIEDGIVLARTLVSASDVPGAYQAFQRARRERVEEVRLQSIHQGNIIQAESPDRISVKRSPSQNRALFDYDPSTAPIPA